MNDMKTINIKGKEYVTVAERIRHLSEGEEGYSIESTYQYFADRKMRVVQAKLSYKGQTYTGLAQEIESTDTKSVNFASALENAETSAIGRACAFAGIGIPDGIASVDEINKAQSRTPVTINLGGSEIDKPRFSDTNIDFLKESHKNGGYQTRKEALDRAFENFKVAKKYQDQIKAIYETTPSEYNDNDDLPF